MIGRVLKRLGGVILAVLLIIPASYAFVVGSGRLALWLDAQQPNQYVVAYPYLSEAVPWMGFGLLGLLGSLAVITSGNRSWRWLWCPAVTLLYCLFVPLQPYYSWYFHRAHHPMGSRPIEWAQDRTRVDFLRIAGELTQQAKSRGAFACPSDDLRVPSRFMSGGRTLVYEVRCVYRAVRAAVPKPIRPATIVMGISEDRQYAWFMATTLMHETGVAVTWVSNYGGYDFVLHTSITDRSKTT